MKSSAVLQLLAVHSKDNIASFQPAACSGTVCSNSGTQRGISVSELTPDVFRQIQLPEGTKGVVITKIDPASPSADAGLQPGDVIQEVDRRPVSSVAGFEQALQDANGRPVLLLVNRKGVTTFRVVQTQ